MANGLDVKSVSMTLPDVATTGWQGNDVTGHFFKAPSDAQGGGLTILEVWVVNGAATGAGTGFSIQVENWGTAGTAVGGTIAAAIGGTADPFAANTPKEGTITTAFVDADEWVVLRKAETNSSDPTRCTVTVNYVMGK